MLALDNGRSTLLVDCGGDAVPAMRSVGLDPIALSALIVTHEHADHVAGFPLLMERLWLMGRREPLDVFGIAPALSQAQRSHDAFDVGGFDGYGGFDAHEIAFEAGAKVLERGGWIVTAAPGNHAVPVVGLRFEDVATGRIIVYSGDTAPDPAITELAHGADLLIHEATGTGPVHASAEEAAEVATAAACRQLLLVHLPPADELEPGLSAARALVPDLMIAEERGRYEV